MSEVLDELGAELVDGEWMYDGEQIEIRFVIRTEDERMEYGDYISNLLDDFGFYVDRQYKTSAEASPIWLQSDPADGLWHLYTGGWIANQISRDDGGQFQITTPLLVGLETCFGKRWNPREEFFDLADKLATNQFAKHGRAFRNVGRDRPDGDGRIQPYLAVRLRPVSPRAVRRSKSQLTWLPP